MADYYVDYAALASLKTSLSVQSNYWNSHLARLQKRVDRLTQSQKISGSGANNIKLYMQSMYGMVIDLLAKLITLHIDSYLLYQRDYHFKADPQADALISETELTAVKEEVAAKKAGITAIDGAVRYALDNVRDIFTFPYNGSELDDVQKARTDLISAITKLDTTIKQIESTHLSKDFVNSGQLISVLKQFLAEAAGQGREFKSVFSPDKLAGLPSYSALLEAKVGVEKELESKAEEIEDAAKKDELIARYEEAHPEIAGQLDALLENVTEEHVREIKYYIYNAEEPYVSLYLDMLGRYSLGNITGKSTGYFTQGKNTINVDLLKEPTNPRFPYTTFFHESGHAIDYNFNHDGKFYTRTYRNKDGQSLTDVLFDDVRNNVSKQINDLTSDPTEQQNVLNYIMGAGSIDKSTLTSGEKAVLANVESYYRGPGGVLRGDRNNGVSDVYGGVTGKILQGDWGHDYTYWYKDGKSQDTQCLELWAHYSAYMMTGNTEAMVHFRELFPQASEFMDEMVETMVKGG